jgi:O-antigen/teichoic acid export membrane protein
MKLNRTENSIRNIFWGVVSKLVMLFFPFIIRTILIKSLGVDFLGLNSLFTSILTVLNLAELGFSSAVVFNMYKPIAENDVDTVCALMAYYRKVYHVIGVCVTVVGIALIPFLPYLIGGSYTQSINITVLYLLFLANTSVSYFLFAYKNCILTAYQREDVISKITIVLKIAMYAIQMAVLLLLRNYYWYVIAMIGCTVATNIVTAYYSDKIYPQYQCKGELSKEKRKDIRKNIQGLMVGKICMVSRNSFDSIFISMFLGLRTVAIYGNYYYIMSAISGILTILMTSLSAGIGNSIATESVEKNYKDMNKFVFIYAWVSGWCTVSLFCMFQPFMEIWMGKEMMFPMIDVILICLYFYSLTMGDVRSQYSSAAGLFWENRKYVLAEALMNIVLNYILGKIFGVHGIIAATLISILLINFVWGSAILFKYYFNGYTVVEFYKKHFFYFGITIVAAVVTYFLTMTVHGNMYIRFITSALMCCIIPNLIYFIVYRNLKEFREAKEFCLRAVKLIRNKAK